MNPKDGGLGYFQPWYFDLKPSTITFHNSKSGERIVEPSYVAVEMDKTSPGLISLGRPLAVGKAALAYQDDPNVAVFSPFRRGQIAHYTTAEYFIKTLLTRLTPKMTLVKPVLCIHVQEQTTEVEERALLDVGIMAGARKVYLYTDPLSTLLSHLPENKSLKDAIILHIEPQD